MKTNNNNSCANLQSPGWRALTIRSLTMRNEQESGVDHTRWEQIALSAYVHKCIIELLFRQHVFLPRMDAKTKKRRRSSNNKYYRTWYNHIISILLFVYCCCTPERLFALRPERRD